MPTQMVVAQQGTATATAAVPGTRQCRPGGLLPLLFFPLDDQRHHSNADPAFGPQQAKRRAHVPLGETDWPEFDVHRASRLYIPAHALGVGRMSLRSRLGDGGTLCKLC